MEEKILISTHSDSTNQKKLSDEYKKYTGIVIALSIVLMIVNLVRSKSFFSVFPSALMIATFFAIIIVVRMLEKIELTVTDKRVYGCTSLGKRVDLPIDSISAVASSSIKKGITIKTSSGAISFAFLNNYQEFHSKISKLILERQEKKIVNIPIVKQEPTQSNADELKKYKDLLDNGVITQEEFDQKKKQLLGL